MGRLLYAEAARQIADFPRVRVYAPVGEHKDLLAYLVRRLLENGANTSFVNRFMDEEVPVADIVRDPITRARAAGDLRASAAADPRRAVCRTGAIPAASISAIRARSRRCARARCARRSVRRAATSSSMAAAGAGQPQPITNPADRREIGRRLRAMRSPAESRAASMRQPRRSPPGMRSAARCARTAWRGPRTLLEKARADFHELLVREAGKTLPDAIAEVREAVDFCRYYALRARERSSSPPRGSRVPPANRTNCRCMAAACSPASVRGISRWRFSPAR